MQGLERRRFMRVVVGGVVGRDEGTVEGEGEGAAREAEAEENETGRGICAPPGDILGK